MKQDLDRVLAGGRSETGGLDSVILAKENARVMLTTNIDVNDRLIDEQMGATGFELVFDHWGTICPLSKNFGGHFHF